MANRTPFVGRTSQLLELERCLDALRSQGGEVVLMAGELAIGKSRLAEELMARARSRKIGVLEGRWYESREMPAYVGFRGALLPALTGVLKKRVLDLASPYIGDLARLGPDFAAALGAEPHARNVASSDGQYRLWRGVSLLPHAIARAGPTLLFLDDLHWADVGSLQLLGFLGREIKTLPILVLGTYRQEDVAPDHPLRDMIAELAHHGALRTLHLDGLSRDEVGALAVRVTADDLAPDLIDALHHDTGGNPLFVEELLREALDGLAERSNFRPLALKYRRASKKSCVVACLASPMTADACWTGQRSLAVTSIYHCLST